MLLRNVSPRGDLDIPLIRRIVPAGETFEVSEDHARRLLDQPDNFQAADDAAIHLVSQLIHEAAGDQAELEPEKSAELPVTAADGATVAVGASVAVSAATSGEGAGQ